MHRIVKRLHFCYGHRLLDYQGKCAHPHGHNGILEVELSTAALDHRGMVLDFGDVKKVIMQFVDGQLDHRMLLRRDDPMVPLFEKLGEPVFVMDDNPTAENIAKLIAHAGRKAALPISSVRLWETHDAYAEFRFEG